MSDLDEVERWASAVQFGIHSPASPGGLRAQVVLARAASAGGHAGAALAAAVAAYGPADQRDRARRTVERITADNPDNPAWIADLGAVEPVRAARLSDEWGEYSALDIDFRRPAAGTHRLRIGIQPFRAGMAHPFAYFASGDEAAEIAAVSFRSEEISLAEARAIAEPGITILEELLSDAYDQPDLELDPSHDLFALVRQRISLLPAGGTAPARPQPSFEEMAAPFGEFAGKPLGYGEDHDNVYHLMRSLIGFVTSCWDLDPLRWTPPRITSFLEEWLPDNGYYCPECRHLHEPPLLRGVAAHLPVGVPALAAIGRGARRPARRHPRRQPRCGQDLSREAGPPSRPGSASRTGHGSCTGPCDLGLARISRQARSAVRRQSPHRRGHRVRAPRPVRRAAGGRPRGLGVPATAQCP